MKPTQLTLIILASSAALVLPGCGVGEASVPVAEQPANTTPVPVEVAYPSRADIFATYDATTTIGSEGDAPVLARVPGEVVELLVEEGDWVDEGQVLARLDGERLRLEMLSAKANLEMARGEYERYVDLKNRGLVSESMFDGLKYDLDALQATYELRRLEYGYSSIRATIPGYVSERSVKLGQAVGMGDETFRITDTSQLVAYMQIPQAELAKFSAGHSATLTVDSMPGQRFDAEIARISPTIDIRNGTFRATAFVHNEQGKLAPGMFARFTIAYEKHVEALTIPREALIEEDDQTAVYIVTEGQVARRQIVTGIETEGQVEVLDGLDEQDQVVVVGQSALRDGSKVLARHDNAESFAG